MVTSSQPKFTPSLCKKSLDMSEQHFKGQFLDRVERDNLRRIDHENKLSTSGNFNNVCTFNPVILEKSEKLRGRSVYEMSRGDLLRRQTNQRMMKLRIEREQLNELTFKPEISNLAKNTGSALRLKEDPTFFLDYYRSNQAKKIVLSEKNILLQAEKELEECTFSPTTIDCPAYVKRIAKSMVAVKAAAAANKGMQLFIMLFHYSFFIILFHYSIFLILFHYSFYNLILYIRIHYIYFYFILFDFISFCLFLIFD